MGVHHNSSSICEISGVLQGTTVQADLLAHFANPFPIELGKQVQLEDTFRNVWSCHNVDLKEFCLKMTFVL